MLPAGTDLHFKCFFFPAQQPLDVALNSKISLTFSKMSPIFQLIIIKPTKDNVCVAVFLMACSSRTGWSVRNMDKLSRREIYIDKVPTRRIVMLILGNPPNSLTK